MTWSCTKQAGMFLLPNCEVVSIVIDDFGVIFLANKTYCV